jgi:N-carbamoylputrescine amidase
MCECADVRMCNSVGQDLNEFAHSPIAFTLIILQPSTDQTMGKVKIGMVQMSCTNDKTANLQKAIDKIKEAAEKGAEIVCLQELFTSLYFCDVEDYENFKLAESIPGPSSEALSKIAKKLGVVIIASLFEKRTEGIYHNTTAVLDADGSYLGKYRKMHIPDDPAYYNFILPGDLGYKVFKTKHAIISILICWDQWYPGAAGSHFFNGRRVLFLSRPLDGRLRGMKLQYRTTQCLANHTA